jgi:hypothetical protein
MGQTTFACVALVEIFAIESTAQIDNVRVLVAGGMMTHILESANIVRQIWW